MNEPEEIKTFRFRKRVRQGYTLLEAFEYMLKEDPLIRLTDINPAVHKYFNYLNYCPKDFPQIHFCLNCPYPKCFREYFDLFKTDLEE